MSILGNKIKKFTIAAVLTLSACNSAPSTEDVEAAKPSIGAYMIVQGRNYNPKDLGPYAASLPPIYEKYGGHYAAFTPKFDIVILPALPKN